MTSINLHHAIMVSNVSTDLFMCICILSKCPYAVLIIETRRKLQLSQLKYSSSNPRAISWNDYLLGYIIVHSFNLGGTPVGKFFFHPACLVVARFIAEFLTEYIYAQRHEHSAISNIRSFRPMLVLFLCFAILPVHLLDWEHPIQQFPIPEVVGIFVGILLGNLLDLLSTMYQYSKRTIIP